MAALISIEGIGPAYAEKLKAAGIRGISSLLRTGATPKGRKALADSTGLSDSLILGWVNRADLFRVRGVGEEYSDLLEKAGVDTVAELAQRKAANLFEKLKAVNAEKKLVRQMPSLKAVTKWIEEARTLPRAVEY